MDEKIERLKELKEQRKALDAEIALLSAEVTEELRSVVTGERKRRKRKDKAPVTNGADPAQLSLIK